MNHHLEMYRLEVRDPEASGPEQIQMLRRRDELAKLGTSLTQGEQEALREADLLLLRHAEQFATEIARCTDLVRQREEQSIPPSRWWWYLDVISHLPLEVPESATATSRPG
jgi:hypothetical protein